MNSEEITVSDKEDALIDEAMKILEGYEEGLSARDFKSMSDCSCCVEDAKTHKKK